MRFLILARSVGLEKKRPKKNHKKSRNRRPWYPRTTVKVNIYIFGLTKYTIYRKKCSCLWSSFSLCCHYAPSFQIKRNISSEKWFNEVVAFFSENAKNLGRSDDAKRRKKRGWPKRVRHKRTLTSRRRKQLLQSLNARAVFFRDPSSIQEMWSFRSGIV